MQTSSRTPRPQSAAALGALLLAALTATAAAQQDRDWRERFGQTPGAAGDWIEFEVLSIDPETFMVTAVDADGGQQLRFKLPPGTFEGQRFTADFSRAREGDRVAVQGLPESKLENLQAAAPLGPARPGRDVGAVERQPPRRPEPPGGAQELRGGPVEYQITSVDEKAMIVTATARDGSEIRLQVHPEAFRGYRFRAPVDDLREGRGFTLLALNETPIQECCTLLSAGGR